MNSNFRYFVLTIFCALFMLPFAVNAQDDRGKPLPEKAEKEGKVEKSEKPDKTVKGLAPVTLEDLAVEFPDVDGWERDEIQKYPSEELGFSVNYGSREGGRVTIYVYNGGRKNIPDDLNDKILKDELKNAKNEIKKVAEMGVYENVKEIKNSTVTLGGTTGKVKSLYTLYNFSARGVELTSEIYLFGHDNKFIKIRATRPRDKDENRNKFIAELFAAIDAMYAK